MAGKAMRGLGRWTSFTGDLAKPLDIFEMAEGFKRPAPAPLAKMSAANKENVMDMEKLGQLLIGIMKIAAPEGWIGEPVSKGKVISVGPAKAAPKAAPLPSRPARAAELLSSGEMKRMLGEEKRVTKPAVVKTKVKAVGIPMHAPKAAPLPSRHGISAAAWEKHIGGIREAVAEMRARRIPPPTSSGATPVAAKPAAAPAREGIGRAFGASTNAPMREGGEVFGRGTAGQTVQRGVEHMPRVAPGPAAKPVRAATKPVQQVVTTGAKKSKGLFRGHGKLLAIPAVAGAAIAGGVGLKKYLAHREQQKAAGLGC